MLLFEKFPAHELADIYLTIKKDNLVCKLHKIYLEEMDTFGCINSGPILSDARRTGSEHPKLNFRPNTHQEESQGSQGANRSRNLSCNFS